MCWFRALDNLLHTLGNRNQDINFLINNPDTAHITKNLNKNLNKTSGDGYRVGGEKGEWWETVCSVLRIWINPAFCILKLFFPGLPEINPMKKTSSVLMLHIFTRSYSRVISGVSFSILCYSILKGIRSPRHKSYSASCSPNVQKNFTSFPKWKIVGFFFLVCWFQLLLLFHCFAAGYKH